MYSSLVMLYASYIIEGKWDIENTPAILRPMIEEIVNEALKKPQDNEEYV